MRKKLSNHSKHCLVYSFQQQHLSLSIQHPNELTFPEQEEHDRPWKFMKIHEIYHLNCQIYLKKY